MNEDDQTSFAKALLAEAPAPGLEQEMALFARLCGSWDLEVTWFDDGQPLRRSSGEWHFALILDGRAVQDIWIAPSRTERALGAEAYEYGTSVRFYDPELGAWRSTWIGPYRGLVVKFIARGVGDDILLEGTDDDGNALRWIFSDIAAESFSWRNEIAKPGQPFVLAQTFAARRTCGSRDSE